MAGSLRRCAIKKFIRTNERIRVPQVRLIGSEGNQLGVVPIQQALELASQSELDLVEVAPAASPPVCRIIDFSKFKYDQEKKEREAKKHQKQSRLKEIRLKPNIDSHDYATKLKQAVSFLKKKDKVKINLFFRGRQMEHQDLGRKILDKFILDTQNDGQVERGPSMEGRIMSFVVAPK
ncbi:MAG: translation initiation factor IF-3 [Omnitrophica WOR_2 bacterium RIFCSPLOWO2_12_FULL_51_8]|nr:MAG: translation initiation factor IF-3 [Omnitrophica WOR_2 bacterium RIFCSPLOWO2_12_FULL_51_8]